MRKPAVIGAVVAVVFAATASAQPAGKHTLRVSTQGSGVVVSSDRRIRCRPRCLASYSSWRIQTLEARPSQWFELGQWSGKCIGTALRCPVSVEGRIAVRAVFKRKQSAVEVVVGGPGVVTSTPAGITCGATPFLRDCGASLGQGTSVTLTAQPRAGGVFRGWGDGCASFSGPTCRIDLAAADVGVLAAFGHVEPVAGTQPLTVASQFGESTPVTSEPPGISCPPTCAAAFPSGTPVLLRFACELTLCDWRDDCFGVASELPCLVVVDAPTRVGIRGLFAGPPTRAARLDLTVSGRGVVSVLGPGDPHRAPTRLECGVGAVEKCSGPIAIGDVLTVSARPIGRARFIQWTGACRGRSRRCTFVMGDATSVVALFRG